jgi:hypothetical protein
MQDRFPVEPNCRIGAEMEKAIGRSAIVLNPLTCGRREWNLPRQSWR